MLPKFLVPLAATLATLPCSQAIILHASDFGGSLSTFNLSKNPDGGPDIASLSARSSSFTSLRAMSLDKTRGLIYALDVNDEVGNGTLYVVSNSTLAMFGNTSTPTDPTWALPFGPNNDGLAVPSYLGSAFTTFNVSNPDAPIEVQVQGFQLATPGPDASQTAAHPHQAILDPSGKYMIVPDLGADLIRLFRLDGLNFEDVEPVPVKAGTGPRHGVFTTTSANITYFYLLGEMGNSITGYEVSYASESAPPTFTQVYNSSTHGIGNSADSGATGGDIHVSPDGGFLLVSSRYDTSSQNATNPTGAGPLISFSIDQTNGNLTLVQQWPIGGSLGAEFAMDLTGTLVAMGYEDQSLLTIVHRDPASGFLLGVAGTFNMTGRLGGLAFDDQPL